MDPLTHLLAGGVIADALDGPPRLGRAALPFAMILGAAPDLDVVPAFVAAFPSNPFSAGLFDPEWMRRLHRGYTHALPILCLVAIIFGWIGWRLSGRSGRRREWLVLGFAALLGHALLDMANGVVRFWLPFSTAPAGLAETPEGNLVLIALFSLCLLANHPFTVRNPRRLLTLSAAAGASELAGRLLGGRMRPRRLAILCLLAAATLLAIRF